MSRERRAATGAEVSPDGPATGPSSTGEDRPGYVRPWQLATTALVAVLSVAATLLGLLVDGFYRDPLELTYQAYGQDTVTLVFVVPLLVAGLVLARRGSLRGYVLWLGSLGYLLYTYAVYAVITEFNPFFLGYVALFGLSLYTFVAGVLAVDPVAVRERLASLPTRVVSWSLAAMGTLVALLWLSEAVPATLADEKPASVADAGLPANVVHVLDLGVVVPAVLLTAWWLHTGRAWGYVLAGVLVVKLTTIGLAVLAMIVWMSRAGEPVTAAEVAVFAVVTLANAALATIYFRSLDGPTTGPGPSSSGATGG